MANDTEEAVDVKKKKKKKKSKDTDKPAKTEKKKKKKKKSVSIESNLLVEDTAVDLQNHTILSSQEQTVTLPNPKEEITEKSEDQVELSL